jgi:hypothetical protein
MHHIFYRDGIAHILTALDGDNKVMIVAVALCETESSDTWDYFGFHSNIFGVGQYLNVPDEAVSHDRMKGIARFMLYYPEATNLECFFHIIDNIYRAAGGKCGIQVKLLWSLRKASTWEKWFDIFQQIGTVSLKAATYIESSVVVERNWRYSLLEQGIRTHGRTTSQPSESK